MLAANTSPNLNQVANTVNLAFTNPKGAKLLADFKQIILELSKSLSPFLSQQPRDLLIDCFFFAT
jgi:hypothetical protein